MPRTLPEYNAISTSEKVQFQTSSGAGKEFVVWQDIDSNVKLVKCDLCSRFIHLQSRSMSTSSLKKHRNGTGCKGLVKQDSNEISGSALEFINTISKWEELKLGIPTFKTDEWRDSNEFPDSDVVQVNRDEMVDSGEESEAGMMGEHNAEQDTLAVERLARKRGMSTVSTLSRQGSPMKKTHHGL